MTPKEFIDTLMPVIAPFQEMCIKYKDCIKIIGTTHDVNSEKYIPFIIDIDLSKLEEYLKGQEK